jgi:hypothetical protein
MGRYLGSDPSVAKWTLVHRSTPPTASDLGVELRVGVQTGEHDVIGDAVAELAVHTGARVAVLAGPSEVFRARSRT